MCGRSRHSREPCYRRDECMRCVTYVRSPGYIQTFRVMSHGQHKRIHPFSAARVNHASYIFTEFKNVIWTVSDEFSLQSEAIRSGLQDLELQSARHFQHRLFFHLHNFSNRPLKQCRCMQIMPSTSAISLLDWHYNYYYQRS